MTINTCKVEQGTTNSLFSAVITFVFLGDDADLAEINYKPSMPWSSVVCRLTIHISINITAKDVEIIKRLNV